MCETSIHVVVAHLAYKRLKLDIAYSVINELVIFPGTVLIKLD